MGIVIRKTLCFIQRDNRLLVAFRFCRNRNRRAAGGSCFLPSLCDVLMYVSPSAASAVPLSSAKRRDRAATAVNRASASSSSNQSLPERLRDGIFSMFRVCATPGKCTRATFPADIVGALLRGGRTPTTAISTATQRLIFKGPIYPGVASVR